MRFKRENIPLLKRIKFLLRAPTNLADTWIDVHDNETDEWWIERETWGERVSYFKSDLRLAFSGYWYRIVD